MNMCTYKKITALFGSMYFLCVCWILAGTRSNIETVQIERYNGSDLWSVSFCILNHWNRCLWEFNQFSTTYFFLDQITFIDDNIHLVVRSFFRWQCLLASELGRRPLNVSQLILDQSLELAGQAFVCMKWLKGN